jgi:protein TonB
MTDDVSRKSAALTASVIVHAALFASLAGHALVTLAVVPSSLLLTLVEPAVRTAGPGEVSAELRVAAPAVVQPMPPVPEPEVVETPIEQEPTPVPVAVAKPKPKPVAKNPAPSPPRAEAAPGDVAAVAPTPGVGTSTGSDSRSSAPAWAPAARIRYEELLFAWMDRNKEYPMLAQRRGLEGSGSVRVRIDRAGRVLARSVDKSTGEAMLDQAALDMVRRASPFPAVPPEYAGEGFEFVAPVQYRLR